jgi:polygalacturonase
MGVLLQVFSGNGVKITNVVFKNITGTSASETAISLACDRRMPCKGIQIDNVHLTYINKPAQALCQNAGKIAIGNVHPTLVCK